MKIADILENKIELLPAEPGVYLMFDKDRNIIYVGKSAILKNRVISYFSSAHNNAPKTKVLVKNIADLEWIITSNELEALILEANLIKKYKPRYNILLMDDKQFPYLKLTLNEEYPRLQITRIVKNDGARYFGPYTKVSSMNEVLELLQKLFPLRKCSIKQMHNAVRTCLEFHIHRCLGPCNQTVNMDVYNELVSATIAFLEGKQVLLLKSLQLDIKNASKNLDFEKALELRNRLVNIQNIIEKQYIASHDLRNQDIVGFAKNDSLACLQLFSVRNGKLNGREYFYFNINKIDSDEELINAFLEQFYSQTSEIPREILIPFPLDDTNLLESWLSKIKGNKVFIKHPKRGEKHKLLMLANKNASLSLDGKMQLERKKMMVLSNALFELQQELKLKSLPKRIECFDISNTQGTNSVGSMVVFVNGEAKSSEYRRFKIKTVIGVNDFASMEEVLLRRFSSLDQDYATMPDLIIVDGGKGQLSSALKILEKLKLNIDVFGLAKQDEILYSQNFSEGITLPRGSEGLFLLQRIRDEAHRFAISFHRDVRDKVGKRSLLDDIEGIGLKRKKILLQQFGSLQKIKQLSLAELEKIDGLNKTVAENLWNALHQ
ncbi:MAG: excinuclease ABC subunit UvrC [Clostridia bacterium]